MRVALVHDDLTQRGGAERVVLALHRLFPEAPIFTSVHDSSGTFEEFTGADVRTTFLQRLPHRGNRARALLPLYPIAMNRIDLRGYDLVVSSSSRFAHGVKAPHACHVSYCHTPARWLYDTGYFGPGGPVRSWAVPALRPLLGIMRRWDQVAARRPDVYVANSREVAARIERVYGREAPVIHPPVDVISTSDTTETAGGGSDPYYLVVSRLLPYKRIDLVIHACAAMGRRLIVVGSGPARQALTALARSVAPGLVEFRSGLSDGALHRLLAGCTALVQAGREDFGLVPIEANAAGRPAVAFAAGGGLETVVDGTTGVHFTEQAGGALIAALERVESTPWDAALLRRHAEGFGEVRFHTEMCRLFRDLGFSVSEPVTTTS